MNLVVLDTNVLVAGLYSRSGASHKALQLVGTGKFDFALSVPLVIEYETVIKRMKQKLGLSSGEIDDVLDYLCSVGIHQEIHYLWRPLLRDPKDEMVLELAVNSGASIIVTHNVKDFAGSEEFGIDVMSPKEFLQLLLK